MLHSLRIVRNNIGSLSSAQEVYKGQYCVYTQKSSDGLTNGSLLEIGNTSKDGVEFSLINPYRDGEGYKSAFIYSGYMLPTPEFLYFFGEQESRDYEILTMIFCATPLAHAEVLDGLWCGVGVKDDQKHIASVPAVAVHQSKRIENWQEAIGSQIGYIHESDLSPIVRKRLSSQKVIVG